MITGSKKTHRKLDPSSMSDKTRILCDIGITWASRATPEELTEDVGYIFDYLEEIKPHNAASDIGRSLINFKFGRSLEAIECLKIGLKKPENTEQVSSIAIFIYAAIGDIDQAYEFAKEHASKLQTASGQQMVLAILGEEKRNAINEIAAQAEGATSQGQQNGYSNQLNNTVQDEKEDVSSSKGANQESPSPRRFNKISTKPMPKRTVTLKKPS